VILRAGPEIFLEAQNMAKRTVTFEEVFTRAGIIPEWIERGREHGKEQGRAQGMEQGKRIIAQNLLKIGMPIEEIAQTTELPLEIVRALSLI